MGTFVSWLIARGIARPISELGQAWPLSAAGSSDHPIAVTSNDEVGDLARAFGDMTERLRESRAELETRMAQLQQTQRQLVHAERLALIGEMSAAVAHGLRNPLASLRAAAQLALRRTKNDESRENLQDIIYEADRLDKRVTHLLDFSRPAPFHPLPDTVSRIVQDVLPPFRKLAEERRVTVEVEVGSSLPEVRVDPVQVEQALLEIVSNALDAMPEGGGLRIRAGPMRRRVPEAAWRSRFRIPAAAFRRTSCPRSASRSSPRGRRAPASASPSPSATSSRTAAGSRSRAGAGAGTTVASCRRLPALAEGAGDA